MITDRDRAYFRAQRAYESARARLEELVARRHIADVHGASDGELKVWDAAIEAADLAKKVTTQCLEAAYRATKERQ
jgi:hypothetical protein